LAARARQHARQGTLNQALAPGEVSTQAALSRADANLLEQAMLRLRLSARAYHRILRVARTIADLDGETAIGTAHLHEALGYRVLDRLPG
ncbi:MAG: magnesium chelatase, partial [Moraxellaceae bacterium]